MSAYYNEKDRFCAQWLRNLIAAGLICDGVVDDRDILDVRPADLAGYTQCHFFAGLGLWSLALRWAGWSDDRPIWTGSCPCQPFSQAGRGDGFADDRHLWPAWEWLISECRPVALAGEQVASSDGTAWLDVVSAALEAHGYAVGTVDIPVAGVGGPNIRQRLWWVADRRVADTASERSEPGHSGPGRGSRNVVAGAGARRDGRDDRPVVGVADTDSGGPSSRRGHDGKVRCVPEAQCQPELGATLPWGGGAVVGVADTEGERESERLGVGGDADGERRQEQGEAGADRVVVGVADADRGRCEQQRLEEPAEQQGAPRTEPDGCIAPGGLADTDVEGEGGRSDDGSGQGAGAGSGRPRQRPAGLRATDGLGDTDRGGFAGFAWDEEALRTGAAGAPGGVVDTGSRGRGEHGLLSEARGQRQDTGQPALADEAPDRVGDAGGTGLPNAEPPRILGTRRRREGRAAPEPSGPPDPWSGLVWIPCRDGRWRPTQSGILPLATRHSGDVAKLRAYGNAISPVVAAEVIRAWMSLDVA